jgi:hypothetical protein
MGAATLIVPAATSFAVEQLAADIGEEDTRHGASLDLRRREILFQLDETAAPATVAQAFPFHLGHLSKRLAPPECDIVHETDIRPEASMRERSVTDLLH